MTRGKWSRPMAGGRRQVNSEVFKQPSVLIDMTTHRKSCVMMAACVRASRIHCPMRAYLRCRVESLCLNVCDHSVFFRRMRVALPFVEKVSSTANPPGPGGTQGDPGRPRQSYKMGWLIICFMHISAFIFLSVFISETSCCCSWPRVQHQPLSLLILHLQHRRQGYKANHLNPLSESFLALQCFSLPCSQFARRPKYGRDVMQYYIH